MTDFEIYGSILYHLVSNSIKHSSNNTKIKLTLDFKFEVLSHKQFSGTLTTRVKDEGSGLTSMVVDNKMEMFAFNKI